MTDSPLCFVARTSRSPVISPSLPVHFFCLVRTSFWFCHCYFVFLFYSVVSDLKRIKYEIRPGEPNRPMSTSPKKVEPILCVGPWQNEGLDLPTTFQKTCSARIKLVLQGWSLLCKDETCSARIKLALQGWSLLCKDETCSTRKGNRTSLL